MRPATILLLTALTIGSCGCQGPSRRAIEGRMSGSLDRMWRGVTMMFGDELRRSTALVNETRAVTFDPHARLSSMFTDASAGLTEISASARHLPDSLTAILGGGAIDSMKRVRALGDPGSDMIQTHRVGPMFAKWRDGLIEFLYALDTSRFILSGPGDPDLSTDPDVLTRQETWIERILQRF